MRFFAKLRRVTPPTGD